MLDPEAVLDRFGDEEFLRELGQRARDQLPQEIAGIDQLRQSGDGSPEMGKRLHKLRGLIANFLEGGDAIHLLRECEEAARSSGQLPEDTWALFRSTLETEAVQLESWLAARGFPCS